MKVWNEDQKRGRDNEDFLYEFSSDHLPHLFFLRRCSIVASEAVPGTNNLPMQVREHFCQKVEGEAGVCQKRRQVSVGRCVTQKETVALSWPHRLLAMKWLERLVESNGQEKRAGDEARTRDSLLGRQEPLKTPLASCASSSRANLHVLEDI